MGTVTNTTIAAVSSRLSCMTLTANTACGPSFAGWRVVRDPLSQFGFANETELDALVAGKVDHAPSMGDEWQCKLREDALVGLRYMGSYACMEQVYLAISGEGFGVYLGNRSCPLGPNAGGAELRSDNPMGSVVLLPKVCNDAISSHLQVSQISNCTSAKDAQMAQRCAYMNATFMPHATFTQHASRAWLGLPAELSLCGFSTSDMSQRYCQTQNNSDPCCTLPLARNPFASWNAVTQRWTLGSAPTPPQPSAPGSPNAGLIAGVAGSCVVALAVAGVAGFMHYRRRPKVEDMAVDRAGASNMTPGLKPLEDAAVKDQLDGYGSFGRDELMDAFSNLSGDEGLPSGNEAGGLVADPLLFGGQNFLSPLTAASSAWSTEQRSPRRGSKSSGSS